HKVPLHGGYVSLQGNMALLLNEGTYNCVSSAILYYVVAGRLGIKTQPQQAPNHVFLKMGDTFIEPTGGKAQSADDHQKFIDKLWSEAKPTDPLIYGDKQYRPTGKMGLVGEIYIDGASKAKDKLDQSTLLTLKACCMSPTNPLYANRAGSKLHSWTIEAIKAKDFAKAKKIAAITGQLYGDSVSSDLFNQIAKAQKHR
ncbi:MAG TPA: transglutaminase family protein, partial [Lacipirellulaceae bacterium]|nr:transglutaminase family protein [Lacipirellulaceae bacterium]